MDRQVENKKGFIKKIGKFDVLLLCLPFLLMTNIIRIISMDKKIYTYKLPVFIIVACINVFFDLLFIFLIVSLAKNLKGIVGRIIYAVAFIFYYFFFVTNCIYYYATDYYFSIHLTQLASEGSGYILSTIKGTKWFVFLIAIVILLLGILGLVSLKKSTENKWKEVVFTIVVFGIMHTILPMAYGQHIDKTSLEEWHIPRNVYDSFNDANKSMKVCGFLEYTVRDIYKFYFHDKVKIDDEEVKYLESEYKNLTKAPDNDYTGMFKGKNVIFLQLEGIDSFLFDEKTMPNLCNMKNNAFVFDDHYSFFNGAGSTFNSEFAVNTGFICPMSYYKNPTFMYSNSFKDSMPSLFKNKGYSVEAFHMNTSEFYNRGLNYDAWGYDKYYGLIDDYKYDDLTYELDTELINNTDFSNKMFKKEQPFVDYIITYTPHTPFSTKEDVGKFLAEKEYGKGNVPDFDEEESVRMMATETDRMIGLLLEKLKENNLYDNTVIVTYADHYLYMIEDKKILEKYKETSNNLINHTPFLIWSSDIENTKEIEKTNSQLDILPTVLNLFGIEYNDNYYIGKDILSDDYSGYVFFDDYSWYDGNVYVENGSVTNGKEIDSDKLKQMNDNISNLTKRNDLTLKYDFFGDSVLKDK